MRRHKLDVSFLSSFISYDEDSGVLTWIKKPARRIIVGSIVGCTKSKQRPYVVFRLFGNSYLGHRVAWALANMQDVPDGYEIDHINGDCSDNRICNLRLALPSQNKSNISNVKGSSGVRGVTWDRAKGKWKAQISSNNKCIWLGNFDDIEDARCARLAAEKELQGSFSYSESRKPKWQK